MRTIKKRIGLPTMIMIGLVTAIVAVGQDTEVKIARKDLPAPVEQTVREQSKGAVVRGFAREVKSGETFYEVELSVKGIKKDVLLDPTGKVVEVEEQVTLNSLPAVARNEIVKQAGKGKILMVESITKDNVLVGYEAHVKSASKIFEIKVNPDGTPMK
jgi:hypothetical protein